MDILSYIIGLLKGIKQGTGVIKLEEGTDYSFTDSQSDGNIVITEVNS